MESLDKLILDNLRSLLSKVLEPNLNLEEFLSYVAWLAKELNPKDLEARVYEVDFIENQLYLRTCTQVDVSQLSEPERTFAIKPKTITGDAIIENRVIVGSKTEGYAKSRFIDGQDIRLAFPIEFMDVDMPEGRTKYVLVVDKKGQDPVAPEVTDALRDFSVLAGLAISIKELRDKLDHYYEENRNLVLTGQHSAAIGHDIRSINVGIGGYLTLAFKALERTACIDEHVQKAKTYVDLGRDSCRQVESLLKDFAQFNRMSIVLNRDTDLADFVEEKIQSFASRMDYSRSVEFFFESFHGKSGFWVDRDWFGTVLENLIKNSVEAGQGKAKVSIRLDRKPNLILLTYEDDCGGLPFDLLPQAFSPFVSGRKTSQGLGLANVRRVVVDHGGRISVTNGPYGAVFTMEFPLEDAVGPGDRTPKSS